MEQVAAFVTAIGDRAGKVCFMVTTDCGWHSGTWIYLKENIDTVTVVLSCFYFFTFSLILIFFVRCVYVLIFFRFCIWLLFFFFTFSWVSPVYSGFHFLLFFYYCSPFIHLCTFIIPCFLNILVIILSSHLFYQFIQLQSFSSDFFSLFPFHTFWD